MEFEPMQTWEQEFQNEPIELKYHTSWDWLMPVVEKVMSCYNNDSFLRTFGMKNEEDGQFMVRFNMRPLFEADTLIEATYEAVVSFIEEHNEDKNGHLEKNKYD